MERREDLLQRVQPAFPGSVVELKFVEGGPERELALAALAEAFAQPAVLALNGDDRADEGHGVEAGRRLGVCRDGGGVRLKQFGLATAERLKGALEAFDIGADLADEALGAGVAGVRLCPKRDTEAGGERPCRGLGEIAGGQGFLDAGDRGEWDRGRCAMRRELRRAGLIMLLPAQGKAHVPVPRSPVLYVEYTPISVVSVGENPAARRPAASPFGPTCLLSVTMPTALDQLAEDYAAWWIDILGEHNHIGGADATRWLLDRAKLGPGRRMLDCGAFVGASARMAAAKTGAAAVACDLNHDFLKAGRAMDGGELVHWVTANSRRLPFRDGLFQSLWVLDADISLKELTRLAAPDATLCLDCEVPVDVRGGVEAFIGELEGYGWKLAGHRQMSIEATNTWRNAEADLVRRRPHFEARYGTRPYLAQLDMLGNLVQSYERLEQGHGLFVFERA